MNENSSLSNQVDEVKLLNMESARMKGNSHFTFLAFPSPETKTLKSEKI
jgi:hypothetical protein